MSDLGLPGPSVCSTPTEKVSAASAKKRAVVVKLGAVKLKKRGLPASGKMTKHGQQKKSYKVLGLVVEVASSLDSLLD